MRETIIRIAAGAVGLILVLLALTWAFGGYAGMSTTGGIALTLGITVTVGLGIALMVLVFYSSRSERDERIYRGYGDKRGM
jgi:hypothetical protein